MIRFSRDHVWVKVHGNEAEIGLTVFAQGELGEVSFVELPSAGKRVRANEPACSIDSLKSASDVYAPVSGTVRSVNHELQTPGSATLINEDPMGQGWLFRMELDDPKELEHLLTEAEYAKLVSPP